MIYFQDKLGWTEIRIKLVMNHKAKVSRLAIQPVAQPHDCWEPLREGKN